VRFSGILSLFVVAQAIRIIFDIWIGAWAKDRYFVADKLFFIEFETGYKGPVITRRTQVRFSLGVTSGWSLFSLY